MHRQRCRDPRDRVYGLLGILKPNVAEAIVPDYTLPLVEVYSRALRVAFEEDGSLNILQFAAWYVDEPAGQTISMATTSAQRWPSWVLKMHASTDSAHGSCLNIPVFEKSDWPLQMRALSDPSVLSVKGLVLSHITYTSGVFSRETLLDSKRLAAITLQCLSQTNRMSYESGNLPASEDLMLTFACGINAQNVNADSDENLSSQYAEFIAWCEVCNSGQEQSPPTYSRNVWRSMNRRFFTTADGKLGMGPLEIRTGDHLCVLSGSQSPFILRSGGLRWKLIGDAYCRRLMKVGTSRRNKVLN